MLHWSFLLTFHRFTSKHLKFALNKKDKNEQKRHFMCIHQNRSYVILHFLKGDNQAKFKALNRIFLVHNLNLQIPYCLSKAEWFFRRRLITHLCGIKNSFWSKACLHRGIAINLRPLSQNVLSVRWKTYKLKVKRMSLRIIYVQSVLWAQYLFVNFSDD